MFFVSTTIAEGTAGRLAFLGKGGNPLPMLARHLRIDRRRRRRRFVERLWCGIGLRLQLLCGTVDWCLRLSPCPLLGARRIELVRVDLRRVLKLLARLGPAMRLLSATRALVLLDRWHRIEIGPGRPPRLRAV